MPGKLSPGLGLGLAKMVLPTLLLNAVTWCVSFTILTTMVKEYICKIANICTVKINILAFPWWRHVVEGIFTIPKVRLENRMSTAK